MAKVTIALTDTKTGVKVRVKLKGKAHASHDSIARAMAAAMLEKGLHWAQATAAVQAPVKTDTAVVTRRKRQRVKPKVT